jgi:hypothetical protein
MKSFITSTLLFTLVASVFAAPARMARRSVDVEDDIALITRDLDYAYEEMLYARLIEDVADALEARTGPFGNTNAGQRNQAKQFVKDNKEAVRQASMPGTSGQSFASNNSPLRIDRQSNGNTQKVAVQQNGPSRGQPTTIGQVAIHKPANLPNWQPGVGKVSKALQSSVHKGKEVNLAPKPQEIQNAQNSANKKAANKANQAAGNANAAKGEFKKGGGKASASFTPINNWKGNGLPKPNRRK